MIRSLLTPEAHRDPYVWAAVLMAHAWIGGEAYAIIGWWMVAAYAVFELAQAAISKRPAWWDSVLDWCAVCLGTAGASCSSSWPAAAVLCIAAAGWMSRDR